MSTVQSMRSPGPHSRRQILTSSSISKRNTNNNDRNNGNGNGNGGIVNGSKPSAITTKNLARPSMHRAPPPHTAAPSPAKSTQPVSNNHLLAGYLAQEFLSKGTLFGEPWDPDRTEDSSRGEKRKASSSASAASDRGGDNIEIQKQQRYIEVADILKGESTHLPGIFNPAQLARFLQMG